MDLIGKIIGRYKIIKQLGAEEVAELYEGVEARRGYPVLIKAVPFLLSDDPALRRQFQQVAGRIAALKNPNLLSWRDIGQEGGTLYIITEMVRASPLFEKLRQPLDLETAIRLIYQVGEALQYAHERDLVHGDLSPQKVLLTEEERVLVTDLGLSSLLKIARTRLKRHVSAYTAPEVRAGRAPDRRSDIYSLGAILYALLTGRAPSMTTIAPPSRFNPAIPPAVETVILKSLSSDPADRYQSVADLGLELSLASVDLAAPGEEHLFEEAEARQEEAPEKVEEVKREEREEGIPSPEIPSMPSLDMDALWGSLAGQIDIQQADISWEAPTISTVEPPPMPDLDLEAVWRSLSAQTSLPSVEEVLSLPMPEPPPMPVIDWKTTLGESATPRIVAPPSPPERKAPAPPAAPPSPPRPRRARPGERPASREEKVRRKEPVSAPPRRRRAIPKAEAPARPRSVWRTIAILFLGVIGFTILASCGCCGLLGLFGEQSTPSRPGATKTAVTIKTPRPTELPVEVTIPTATPGAPKAGPAPTEGPVFADDFAQPDSGWAKEIKDDYEIGYFEGQYRILVKKKNTVAWSTLGQSFTDFLLVVNARQAGGSDNNSYGLIYRYQDSDNFYYFRISGNGFYSAAKMVDGQWKTLVGWKQSPYINRGQSTNHLKLVCRGRYMSFYVNGEHLAEWRDSTFAQGDIGLAAGTYGEAGVLIYFDDLEVYAVY